eukprot:264751-Amphidinium_carterae.1
MLTTNFATNSAQWNRSAVRKTQVSPWNKCTDTVAAVQRHSPALVAGGERKLRPPHMASTSAAMKCHSQKPNKGMHIYTSKSPTRTSQHENAVHLATCLISTKS